MFDLTSLRPVEFVMQVRHPATREPLVGADGEPVVIRLVGQDSEQFLESQRAQADRRFARKDAGQKPTAADLDAESLETAVACTVGWSGIAMGEAELEYSSENARRLYTELHWLHEQVHRALASRANFFSC